MKDEPRGHEGIETPLRNVEAELADLIKYVELYVRQRTDLYIRHYVFDPLDFIFKQVIYLSVLASLLVVGTVSIAIGIVLFVSTLIPLYAALLIVGVSIMILACIVLYVLFSNKITLKTPKTPEETANEHV